MAKRRVVTEKRWGWVSVYREDAERDFLTLAPLAYTAAEARRYMSNNYEEYGRLVRATITHKEPR